MKSLLRGPERRDSEQESLKRLRVLVASGASAGHLYPALAFAQSLTCKWPDSDIAFVTSKRAGIENCIPEAGYEIFFISICPFGLTIKKFLQAVYRFAVSFLESFFIIERLRPDIVVGFGSYVSFPVLLEAALFKKPTIIHEQNLSLGLANKALSFFVDKVAVSFKETAVESDKSVFTGNPLRKSLIKIDKEKAGRFFNLDVKFTILTLGGSQGARKINAEFEGAVGLLEKEEDFQFIHITGKKDYSDLKKNYNNCKIKHCVFDFLKEMHLAYSLADLVICRAGATTIAELAYFNKAAILIPYPYARSHQLENAHLLAKEGAAVVIEEKELDYITLSGHISTFMHSDSKRKFIEGNIQKFSNPSADSKLAEAALSLVS